MRTVLSLGLVALVACNSSDALPEEPLEKQAPARVTLTEEGVRNAEVRIQKLTHSEFAPKLTLAATIEPDPADVAHVGARVSGRVASIDVRLGDSVKRDQAVASVETIEIHQTATEYMVALARAKEAVEAKDRQKHLVDERVGAVADLRRAEADAAAASATLQEATEHLRFLGLTDSAIAAVRAGKEGAGQRSIIRSPLEGQVTALDVTLGQVLAGNEEVVTIIKPGDLWATVHVFERDAAAVRVGAKVAVAMPSLPHQTLDASISVLSAGINRNTRTMEARAKLGQVDAAIRPGMSATATIALPPDGNWWLPSEAVQSRGSERIVFIEVGERQFEPRAVSAGAERNGFVPVTSGVKEGDMLVVHGAFALRGELERENEE